MLTGTLRAIGNTVSTLGECPVWDAEAAQLFWVDSLSNRIHCIDNDGNYRQWGTTGPIGSIALVAKRDTLLCALPDEISILDLDTGGFRRLASTPNDPTVARLNDGKCDRKGRFWVGTLTLVDGAKCGELYRIDPNGSVSFVFSGFTNSNGLAFPPDEDFFWHSDSRIGVIYKVTELGNGHYHREPWHQTKAAIERPDGAAVDEDGYYWSALYGGGCVVRIDPNGNEMFRFEVPTAYPTMVAFGGDDLRTLYITSATLGGLAAATENDPLAGRLFSVRTRVAGIAEPRFNL